MLSFEFPAFEQDGILVYRDHAVPHQFYYTAPLPKISRTGGRLMFDVFAYTVDLKHSPLAGTTIPYELGAGFLTMGVDCELSAAKRGAIASALADQAQLPEDKIALAPVPYHKGTVRVLALDQFTQPNQTPAEANSDDRLNGRPTFVEKVIGSTTPALLGDLRTIFSLSLSKDGVAFLQGLYANGAAPVGIVYELNFYGLRPSVEAKVTANLSRIYQHFGGGLSGQYQWFKAEIEVGLEFLQEQGAIQIELTSQAIGEEAQKSKELALSLFKDRIVQELFRPTTPAVPTSQLGNLGNALTNAAGQASQTGKIGLTLRFKRTEELKTVTYDFRERSPEERTHAPQNFLPLLLSPVELQRRIHSVDLGNDFFELLEVLVAGPTPEEFEALNIRQVEATLTYGNPSDGLPVEQQSLLFRPNSTGDKLFAAKRRGRKSLAYTCALTYEFTRSAGIDSDRFRYELPARLLTDRVPRINPYSDFGVLDVEVEPGRLHPDIRSVDVKLAYQSRDNRFSATETFRINLTDPANVALKRHWQVRTLETVSAPYSATYTFTFSDGTVYTALPLQDTALLLQVDSPFSKERRLLIQPHVASPQVTQITVELEYQDPTNQYDRRFLVTLQPPFISQEVKWPVLDANQQTVRYRAMVYEPGFIGEGEWQETADPSIVVGAAESRLSTVTIRLVGPALSSLAMDAVQLNLELAIPGIADVDRHELLFDGSQTSQEVKFALPPGETLRYRYQTIAFKTDGQMVESEWKDMTNTLLVISTRSL